MFFRLSRALALALIALPWPAAAQCPSCRPIVAAESDWHGWYAAEDDPAHLELYWHGEKIGRLDPLNALWQTAGKDRAVDLVQAFALTPFPPRPLGEVGGQRSEVSKKCCRQGCCFCRDCPNDCCCQLETRNAKLETNYGVQIDKIAESAAYEINGKPTTRQSAFRVLEASLEDDRSKWFLTAVLADGPRKQFLDDLNSNPALQPWKGKLHINAYPPTDWHVAQIGLAEGISYQPPPDAQGRSQVRFRFRSYTGAEALAGALRDADKNYKPDGDPDPTVKPAPKVAPPPPKSPTPALTDDEIAGIAGGSMTMLNLLLVYLRRRFNF